MADILTQVRSQCSNKLMDWFMPTFSTTTNLDRFVSQLVLMATIKEYFGYYCELSCGFSEVTLEGNREDWVNILERVQLLKTFDDDILSQWSQLLTHVLEHFVRFFDTFDDTEEDFWQRAVTSERRGSGGQKNYRGWFLVFAPFSNGRYQLLSPEIAINTHMYGEVRDDDIENCIIDFPISINDHGSPREVTLYTGSWLMSGTQRLQPVPSFLIVEIDPNDLYKELWKVIVKPAFKSLKAIDLNKTEQFVKESYKRVLYFLPTLKSTKDMKSFLERNRNRDIGVVNLICDVCGDLFSYPFTIMNHCEQCGNFDMCTDCMSDRRQISRHSGHTKVADSITLLFAKYYLKTSDHLNLLRAEDLL